jgi:HAD superfamily hydrolase (TIGR01509 family)
MIRLVIFDCDGVMFDSRESNAAYYNAARTHFGLAPMNAEERDWVHMATDEESIRRIMPPDLRGPALAFLKRLDYSPFVRLLRMEPDLVNLLDWLRPERKTAVCTNRNHAVRKLLDEFDLGDRFDLVVTADDVMRPKPDPEPIRMILDRFEAAPAQALYVGDSDNDALAARAAGTPLVLYRNPGLAADHHVDRLAEVRTIIEGLEGSG